MPFRQSPTSTPFDLAATGAGNFPLQPGEVGVYNTQYPPYRLERYGATPGGTVDATGAWNNAVASIGANAGTLEWGPGVFLVIGPTAKLTHSGQVVKGAGQQATTILYAPAATNGKLFAFDGGGSAQVLNGIRGLTLSSAETALKKTGIDVVDQSLFIVDDLTIGPQGSWTGGMVAGLGGSIGLRTRGRDVSKFSRLLIAADVPISIGKNPNTVAASAEDCDHCHYQDCYLIAGGDNPCFTIESGAIPSNLTIDGYQAWALGAYGLKWDDTTAPSAAFNVRIANVRWEQGTQPTGWAVYINPHTAVRLLTLENCTTGGSTSGGYRIRNANDVRLSVSYTNVAGVALDVDASCDSINTVGCFWQQGSTVNLTGLQRTWSPVIDSAGVHPEPATAHYNVAANATPWGTDFNALHVEFGGLALADGALVQTKGSSSSRAGRLFVTAKGPTKFESGVWAIGDPATLKLVSGTANCADTNTATKLCAVVNAPSSPLIVNHLGEAVDWHYAIQWFQ